MKNGVIEPLKDRGCRVWAFGSRARGDHHPFSDIDLLYEQTQSTPLPDAFVAELRETAQESDLPYKVDLVDLAESYRQRAFAERTLL